MSDFFVSSDSAALVQKSVITQPGFFGDPSLKDSTASFGQAVGICASLAGAASSLASSNAPAGYKRTATGPYFLTQAEKNAIDRKSNELSLIGVVPYDTLRQFFYILASLQDLNELAYVANVVGIPEMNNATLVRNILGILNLRDIYKVGYLANGVASVIQAFSGNFSGAQSASSGGASNILGAVSKILGAAAAVGPLVEQVGGSAIGNFMSELVTGSRLTTQQIARNPSLTPPSYQGKAFFGESGVGLPAVDQMFCRRVGAFGEESGSNGSVSFGFQNFASFGQGLSMASMIAKMTIGTTVLPPAATAIGQQVTSMISNVSSVLNVATNAVVEPRRSDNAIPFLIGLSSGIAESVKCPFNTSTFTEGWKVASSVGNDLQRYNPQYLETCRTSL